jgi:hypothetical protein
MLLGMVAAVAVLFGEIRGLEMARWCYTLHKDKNMGNILRSPTNNNALYLTPRTASHSFVYKALETWWPEITIVNPNKHPAAFLPSQENWNGDNINTAIIVRNPIERFRSMIAHRKLNIEEQLISPMYPPLQMGSFVRYFRFETELELCAEWLGLTWPINIFSNSDDRDKPTLTSDQEAIVRQIYADDIKLWESLNNA